MPRVNNATSDISVTPLAQLEDLLAVVKPGEKITLPQTKDEFLKVQKNLTQRRHEIPNADAHLAYIEACLIAEARGQLQFKG